MHGLLQSMQLRSSSCTAVDASACSFLSPQTAKCPAGSYCILRLSHSQVHLACMLGCPVKGVQRLPASLAIAASYGLGHPC